MNTKIEKGLGDTEAMHPLRQQLKEIDSPLARMLEKMAQDRSLERIDDALNMIGQSMGLFSLVENEEDANTVLEDLKVLTNLDDKKEIKTKIKEIANKIENF